jgi:hypothetical protein
MSALRATLLCLSYRLRTQTGERSDQSVAQACFGLQPQKQRQQGANR